MKLIKIIYYFLNIYYILHIWKEQLLRNWLMLLDQVEIFSLHEINENFIELNLFIFSDKAQKPLNLIKEIIYNKTLFELELKKRFEIYRDIVLINKLNLGFTSYGRKVL